MIKNPLRLPRGVLAFVRLEMNAAQRRNQAFELRDLQDEQEVEAFLRDEENAPGFDHRSHTFFYNP